MRELLWPKFRRGRFGRDTRRNSSLNGSGGYRSGMTVVEHRKHFFRALVEHLLKVCNFLSVISCLCVFQGNEIFCNVRKLVSMFL